MPRHRAQATELEKSRQFFVGINDESLSVVAMRVNGSRARIEQTKCEKVSSVGNFFLTQTFADALVIPSFDGVVVI